MKLFNVGAPRQATDDARLSAANDLVQRTLAQHGLASPSAMAWSPRIPSMDGMLTRFSGSAQSLRGSRAQMPDGAEVRQDSFNCRSGSRVFHTYIPASASKGIRGVVMMLHGCTQTPDDFATGTGMNTLAEQHRLVVVYPAQSRGDNAQSCWNWFSRGDQKRGRGEPAILAGIAAQVCAQYQVGRDQTFVAGLSAGAAMAVILGETYSDIFSAVGAHSGLPLGAANDAPSAFAAMAGNALDASKGPKTEATVRTIVFHGTADTTVHPSNGDAIVRRALDIAAGQSIDTSTQGDAAGRSYIRTNFSDIQGNVIIEHWVINGQGHAWSGGQAGGSYTDPKGPDASAEMIRFFLNTSNKEPLK